MMDQDYLMNKLEELLQKFNALEKSIEDKSNPSIIVKIDVKDLHLQELKLEELAFHLEKLDIKELSGMLNLGNTFSPVVQRKPKAKRSSVQGKPQSKEDSKTDIQININGKSVPYTMD
jgi:hypothetical protein